MLAHAAGRPLPVRVHVGLCSTQSTLGGFKRSSVTRIDAEESYRMLDGVVVDDSAPFTKKLEEWERVYNFDCPHGTLGGQTPYERLRWKGRRAPASAATVSCNDLLIRAEAALMSITGSPDASAKVGILLPRSLAGRPLPTAVARGGGDPAARRPRPRQAHRSRARRTGEPRTARRARRAVRRDGRGPPLGEGRGRPGRSAPRARRRARALAPRRARVASALSRAPAPHPARCPTPPPSRSPPPARG